MPLTETDRNAIGKRWIVEALQKAKKTAAIDVPNINAAADAANAWVDLNQANFVASIPEPFASNTTAQEKTLLFAFVILRRAGLI